MTYVPIANETHAFSVADAMKYGVEQAIILNTIRYWLRKNHADGRNIKDGYVWTYNTAKKLHRIFPYWSEQKCQRLMKNLSDSGVIITANHNSNKWNQERWYTLPEFKIDAVDNSEPEADNNSPKKEVSSCNSALFNSDECNSQNWIMHSSRSMNVHSSNLMNDPYQDLTQDLTSRSIHRIDPSDSSIENSFNKIFWPVWEGRKIARGECLALFRNVVEREGRDAEPFARELVDDIKRRRSAGQQGFDKMHPKSYLKGRRWEDQLFSTLPESLPPVSNEAAKLRSKISEFHAAITSERAYRDSIKPDNPLRNALIESSERKIAGLSDLLRECKNRLKLLEEGG